MSFRFLLSLAFFEAAIVSGAILMEDFFPLEGHRKWVFVVFISSLVILVVWSAITFVLDRRKEAKRKRDVKLQAQVEAKRKKDLKLQVKINDFFEGIDTTLREVDQFQTRQALTQIRQALKRIERGQGIDDGESPKPT